eukprot:scaffold1579_cov102-Skeletonema_dohrnii-CCMP3373.AAC.11
MENDCLLLTDQGGPPRFRLVSPDWTEMYFSETKNADPALPPLPSASAWYCSLHPATTKLLLQPATCNPPPEPDAGPRPQTDTDLKGEGHPKKRDR